MKNPLHLMLLLLILGICLGMSQPARAEDRVVLLTSMGDIVIKLDPELAPKHVAQFLNLVRTGAYDTTRVHAIEPGYVMQVSNVENRRLPLNFAQAAAAKLLKAEFSKVPIPAGSVIMAREPNDPDSASSSFSILLSDAPHLVGSYTLFGSVEEGMDVVRAIGAVATDAQKRPLVPVEVQRAYAISPQDLAKIRLHGPIITVPAPLLTSSRRPFGFMLLICLLAAIHYGLMETKRLSPTLSRSLVLLQVLISFFALFEMSTAATSVSAWVPTLIFFGLIAVLKLMGRFESQR